jgi:hypothetical protein
MLRALDAVRDLLWSIVTNQQKKKPQIRLGTFTACPPIAVIDRGMLVAHDFE